MQIPTDIGSGGQLPSVSTAASGSAIGVATERLGAAMQQTAGVVSAVGHNLLKKQDELALRKKTADDRVWESTAKVNLMTEYENTISQMPELTTEQRTEVFNSIHSNLSEKAPSHEAASNFLIDKNTLWGGHYFPKSLAEEAQLRVYNRQVEFNAAFEGLKGIAAKQEHPSDVGNLVDAAKALAGNMAEAFPGETDPNLERKMVDGIVTTSLNAQLDKPNGGTTVLEDLKSGAYTGILTADSENKMVAVAQRRADAEAQDAQQLLKEASAQAQHELTSAQAVGNAELSYKIEAGLAGFTDVDKYFAANAVSEVQAWTLRKQIDNRNDQEGKKAKSIQDSIDYVKNAISDGLKIANTDALGKDGVEALWAEMKANATKNNSSDADLMRGGLSLIDAVSQMPNEFRDKMNAASRDTRPDRVLSVANLYGEMEGKAGTVAALDNLAADTRDILHQVYTTTRAGMEPAQAVKLAHHNVFGAKDLDRQEIAKRQDIKDFNKDVSPHVKAYIDTHHDKEFWYRQPEATAALTADYKLLANTYLMTNGGNLEMAKQRAASDLNRMWGASYVTGKAVMMKYAPELKYGGGVVRAFNNSLSALLSATGLKPDGVELVYDNITAKSKGASFALLDKYTAMPVLDKKTKQPLRWEVPQKPKE